MKPYVTCYMMMSVDGRIDCAMTEQIEGSKEYYEILNKYNFDACMFGKTTARMHYASGDYIASNNEPFGKKVIYKALESLKYNVVLDTKGSLCWNTNQIDYEPLIVILSEDVSKEYLMYLADKKISYIVTGCHKIDLNDALNILHDNFGIKTLGVVGGGHINGSLLDAGLLDEISILIEPGIDGRDKMAAVFDGIPMDRKPFKLLLKDVRKYNNGVIWLQYNLK